MQLFQKDAGEFIKRLVKMFFVRRNCKPEHIFSLYSNLEAKIPNKSSFFKISNGKIVNNNNNNNSN